MGMLNDQGVNIGRFKVRPLMGEFGLISKQSGSRKYKKATVERLAGQGKGRACAPGERLALVVCPL